MVATMLMIFFAVALGTVIMTWGTSYAAQQGDIEAKTEEATIKCDKFVLLHHNPANVCASSIKKRVSFTLKNDGQIAVNGLKIALIGQNNFETTVFDLDDVNLQAGEERAFNQNYDYARLGHLLQVEVHSKIFFRDSTTQYHKCAQKLVIENIEKC